MEILFGIYLAINILAWMIVTAGALTILSWALGHVLMWLVYTLQDLFSRK